MEEICVTKVFITFALLLTAAGSVLAGVAWEKMGQIRKDLQKKADLYKNKPKA